MSGKLSVLPLGKGVLISHLCEPEQYVHINEGLVIVPMFVYLSKHQDVVTKNSCIPVVFAFSGGSLGLLINSTVHCHVSCATFVGVQTSKII